MLSINKENNSLANFQQHNGRYNEILKLKKIYAVNQKIIVLLLRWSSTGGRAGGDLARPRDLGPGYGSLSRPGLGGARERPSLASLGASASWAAGARHQQEPAR